MYCGTCQKTFMSTTAGCRSCAQPPPSLPPKLVPPLASALPTCSHLWPGPCSMHRGVVV